MARGYLGGFAVKAMSVFQGDGEGNHGEQREGCGQAACDLVGSVGPREDLRAPSTPLAGTLSLPCVSVPLSSSSSFLLGPDSECSKVSQLLGTLDQPLLAPVTALLGLLGTSGF